MKKLIILVLLIVFGAALIGCVPQGKYEYTIIDVKCSYHMVEGELLTCSSGDISLQPFDAIMNIYANDGWRVINIDPYYNELYPSGFYSMFVTFERQQ